MANTYFQFKHFRIDQENCAMKVCTDACLQGAYAIESLKKIWNAVTQEKRKILDIGTGTGLLSLMLAQEISGAQIDAVELDSDAYLQAVKNVAGSPWQERIRVLQGDIREFPAGKGYDFIICNPPFYDNDLRSEDRKKNQAKHGVTLKYHELIDVIKENLSPSGCACIMLPPKQFNVMMQIATNERLFPAQIAHVSQSGHSGVFRVVGVLRKDNAGLKEEEISIKDADNKYTGVFKNLLKEFYLNF